MFLSPLLLAIGCAHAHDPGATDAVHDSVNAATANAWKARVDWLSQTHGVLLIGSRDVGESRRAYDVVSGALNTYETAAFQVVNTAMALPIDEGSPQAAAANAWLSGRVSQLEVCTDDTATTIPSFDYYVDADGYAYLTGATAVTNSTDPSATTVAQTCLFRALLHGGLAPADIRDGRYKGVSL